MWRQQKSIRLKGANTIIDETWAYGYVGLVKSTRIDGVNTVAPMFSTVA